MPTGKRLTNAQSQGAIAATGIAPAGVVATRRPRRAIWLGGLAAATAIISVVALSSGPEHTPTVAARTDEHVAAEPVAAAPSARSAAPHPPATAPTPGAPRPASPAVSSHVSPPVSPSTPRRYTVQLATTPRATVKRDGATLGTTPLDVAWTEGEAPPRVTLEALGFESQDLELTPGDALAPPKTLLLEKLKVGPIRRRVPATGADDHKPSW